MAFEAEFRVVERRWPSHPSPEHLYVRQGELCPPLVAVQLGMEGRRARGRRPPAPHRSCHTSPRGPGLGAFRMYDLGALWGLPEDTLQLWKPVCV